MKKYTKNKENMTIQLNMKNMNVWSRVKETVT